MSSFNSRAAVGPGVYRRIEVKLTKIIDEHAANQVRAVDGLKVVSAKAVATHIARWK